MFTIYMDKTKCKWCERAVECPQCNRCEDHCEGDENLQEDDDWELEEEVGHLGDLDD